MNDLKSYYKIMLLIAFFSFLFGLGFFAVAFDENCKSRQELCSLDLEEIALLRKQLKKTEDSCIEQLKKASDTVRKNCEASYKAKMIRIEKSCNELDCLQCKRE